MYMLYLDDSGSVSNKSEKHFVLAGAIIHEKSLFHVNQYMETLSQEIFPTVDPRQVEFHAAEIVGGRTSPWNTLDRADRFSVLKKVLNVVCKQKSFIKIVACAVEKKYFTNENVVNMAFEDVLSRFQFFLQNHTPPENGIVILDKLDTKGKEEPLQQLAADFRLSGNQWGRKITNIQEVPLFVNSKSSRAIQLADHIAYAVFRRYEHQDLNYFNVFQGCFYSNNHRLHGLSHKTNDRDCLCPYCVQKGIIQGSP